MSFSVKYSATSSVSEKNLWLSLKGRDVCLSYEWNPKTGDLKYAASIYRKTDDPDYVLTDEERNAHHHTTGRRFELRPVIETIEQDLTYDDMLYTIRKLMCHGPGCVGPKTRQLRSSTNEESSSVTSSYDGERSYAVAPVTFYLKTSHRLRYITENRDIFIVFKGARSSGDVLFGASIYQINNGYHLSDEHAEDHFMTAESRMDKCPVHLNISEEFRHQLSRNTPVCGHREDAMMEMVDTIMTRRCGHMQTRGATRYDGKSRV
tara:strand:+ start:56 stop:844 length:789 start_codon:yes stop_codon:yes gene_type:complete